MSINHYENPKRNYDNLVRYLKNSFIESVTSGMCSDSCHIRHMLVYQGTIQYCIRLLGKTSTLCVNCSHYVSDYSHSYCVHCAPKNSIEYLYHHSKCHPDIQRKFNEKQQKKMTIKIYYNFIAECKSQIISVNISKHYDIMWHCLENEKDYKETFYQSCAVQEVEFEQLKNELIKLFNIEKAPLWLLDKLTDKIVVAIPSEKLE